MADYCSRCNSLLAGSDAFQGRCVRSLNICRKRQEQLAFLSFLKGLDLSLACLFTPTPGDSLPLRGTSPEGV